MKIIGNVNNRLYIRSTVQLINFSLQMSEINIEMEKIIEAIATISKLQ